MIDVQQEAPNPKPKLDSLDHMLSRKGQDKKSQKTRAGPRKSGHTKIRSWKYTHKMWTWNGAK